MLSDEDTVRFVLGECFVALDKDQAEARLEAQSSECDKDLATYAKELEGVKAQMTELKVQLYAKFGNSINLEEDPS